MKKILVLLFCLVLNNVALAIDRENSAKIAPGNELEALFAGDDLDNFPEIINISLGFSCTVARKLRDNDLRCYSFPFDWLRSSFQGVCNLFENDFSDLFNPRYLSFEKTYILNNKYCVAFYHDFPLEQNYLESLDEIVAKYNRRIERLYRALHSDRVVYFFRFSSCMDSWKLDTMPQTQHEVKKLRDMLLAKFPQCNFTLVVIDNDVSYQNDWQMAHVKNFYMQDHSSSEEWKQIFISLGLLQA